MPDPLPLYNPRSRQVSLVLMMGLMGAMVAFFLTIYLPGYGPSVAVSDGKSVSVLAHRRSVDESGASFAFTRSKDGSQFGPMNVRSGSPTAAAMVNGEVYCLFADGQLARFGEEKKDWQTLRFDLKWSPDGLAVFDDDLWAVGHDRQKHQLLTAHLHEDKWQAGPSIETPDDNVLAVRSAQAGGRRLLFWEGASGQGDARKYRIAAAELTDNASKSLPAFPLAGEARFTASTRDGGVDVFTWSNHVSEIAIPGEPIRLQRVRFENDAWGEATSLDVTMGPEYDGAGSTSVARVDDRVYVYSFRYIGGLLYSGLYGVELREGGPSQPFRVRAPLPHEVQTAAGWTTFAVGVLFLAGGGLAGAVMLRRVESRRHPMIQAPYASVIDRALATSFDVMLIFMLMQIVPGDWSPGEFWISFVLAQVAYNVFTEAAGGQTLGKKMLGLRVLTVDGRPVTLLHAFRRNAFKPIEIITVGVGCCLVTSRFQRPGDFLAGTVVIKELRMPRHVEEGEESKS